MFRSHYNIYLQSITVNGQLLPIDLAVFTTSVNQGTIVDSGTTLAYLVEGAYDPLIAAVKMLPSVLYLIALLDLMKVNYLKEFTVFIQLLP